MYIINELTKDKQRKAQKETKDRKNYRIRKGYRKGDIMNKSRFTKLKKVMAFMLSLALVLSVYQLPAKAAPGAPSDVIVDASDVQLTVHRYQYVSGTPGTPASTGGSIGAPTGLTGMEVIEGTGYTIYKIADVIQEANQTKYEVTDDDLKTLIGTTVIDPSAVTGVDVYGMAGVKARLEAATFTTKSAEVATNASGAAVFTVYSDNTTKLGKGLYLVVETTPKAHTAAADPFLVSLPMTKTDGSEWLYDVHAYPKTQIQSGNIKIVKKGKIGNEAAQPIEGAKFLLQKETAANVWKNVTENSLAVSFVEADDLILVPAAGKTIESLPSGNYRIIECSVPSPYIADSSNIAKFTVNATGGIEGVDCTSTNITYSAGTATFTFVNEQPTIAKTVQKKTGAFGKTADYSIGEEVPFKLEVTIPSNIAGVKTFKILDTFGENSSHEKVFEFNAANDAAIISGGKVAIEFFSGTTDKTSSVKPGGSAFTLTGRFTSDANGFVIDLSEDEVKTALSTNHVDKAVVTVYLKLKNNAVIAGEGNLNTGKLEYTNHIYSKTVLPGVAPDPDDPFINDDPGTDPIPKPEEDPGANPIEERTELTDQAAVYSFKVSLTKTFAGSTGGALQAEFELYDDADNLVEGGITLADGGTYEKAGLSNGNYYFKETGTADGYSLLKEKVNAPVAIDYSKTEFEKKVTTKKYDTTGTLLDEAVVSTVAAGTTTYTGGSQPATINVINVKVSALPVTGGTGTLIFTLVGIILMAGGILVFTKTKKRQSN